MSSPTPSPTPAAPAAPASTTPPATPAAAPASDRHPALEGLMKSLLNSTEEGKKQDAKPANKPAEKPADQKPEAKPADKAPEPEKPITVRKPKPEKRPPLPTEKSSAPAAPAPVAPAPAAPQPEVELQDDEKQFIDDFKELERRFPDKHKGKGSAAERFIRENIRRVGAAGFDPEDPEYQKWVAEFKPKATAVDHSELQTARVREQVQKDADEKINSLRHENFVSRETPRIKTEAHQMITDVARTVLPDEILTDIGRLQKEHGQKWYEEAYKLHGFEMDIANAAIEAAKSDIEEFFALTTVEPQTMRPLKSLDANNPQHQRLIQMVANVCDQFKQSGEAQQKDGKWFVTRSEWNSLPASERSKYWTFSDKEIAQRALKALKPATMARINQQRAAIERYNFKRTAAAGAPPPPTPSTGAPPAIRPSPVPSEPSAPGNGLDPRVAQLMSNFKQN